MARPLINPALGLNLVTERTLEKLNDPLVTVLIPAHNEAATVAGVVADAEAGLSALSVRGEVLVSASGCTDDTAAVATEAGAIVVEAPAGKGAALRAGLTKAAGDVVCLVDGDMQYFGDRTLVEILVAPILAGIADATVSDLYWRPLYPQLWLHGFFAPIAGRLFPEMLPKVGSTPWSGQRAAKRELWPTSLPDGFTVDLAILLWWNRHALRLRPVLADDWVNPQRPKPDLMAAELELLTSTAIEQGRLRDDQVDDVQRWYDQVHELMAAYDPEQHDPTQFEQHVLQVSMEKLPYLPSRSPRERVTWEEGEREHGGHGE
jgi:glycosyltransferase involved in cell wall biosynthesis